MAESTKDTIGIVILNYNTFDDAVACVESVAKTTKADYLIYIVDNCSEDNSYSKLLDCFHENRKIKVMRSDYNGGYSYGNDIGIRQAITDGCNYILIANPDIVFYEDSIDKLLEALKSDDRIGVIGPSISSLDQEESQLLRKVYTPKVYFFSKKPFLYLSKVFKNLKTEYNYPESKDELYLFKGMVSGCCFLMASDLFNELGLLDDHVFLYTEEWILAKKLRDLGKYCAYDPGAKVLHKEATSTAKVGTGFQSFHLYLSAFYYLKYYSGCQKSFLWFSYFQNVIGYSVKSMKSKSYRSRLFKFIDAQNKLMRGTSKKIGFDRMME